VTARGGSTGRGAVVTRWVAACLAQACLLGASALPAAADDQLDFDWSVPPLVRTDPGPNGLPQYATPPSEVRARRWPVRLRVVGRCDRSAVYRWLRDDAVVAEGRGSCVREQIFPAQGAYPVTLEREDARGTVRTTQEVLVRNFLVVALGDSVASGEGNPDIPGGHAQWQDRRCHRSALAGVARAAKLLEDADDRTSVTFVDLACSGATIPTGLLGEYEGIVPLRHAAALPSQVSELAEIESRVPVDAVVLSVGANDVSFSKVVLFCVRHNRCVEQPFDPLHPLRRRSRGFPSLEHVVDDALRRLSTAYDQLAAAMPRGMPSGRVHVVEYFDPTHDRNGVCRRKLLGPPLLGPGIKESELRWAHDRLLDPLNAEIAAAARRIGWQHVTGIASDFRSHGYCTRDERWVATLWDSLRNEGGSLRERTLGTLHPNVAGHEDIARRIYASLRAALYSKREPRPPDEPHRASGADGLDGGALDATLGLGALAALIAAGSTLKGQRDRRRFISRSSAARSATAAPPPVATEPVPRERPEDGAHPLETLLATSTEWVHRRVETVRFADDTLRRHVSIDFTPPAWTDGDADVPVAILAKAPLTDFDLRDAAGAALPMATRGENATRAAEAILQAILNACRDRGLSVAPDELDRLGTLAFELAVGSPDEAADALAVLARHPEAGIALADERVARLAETFVGGFMVLVRAQPGRRQIVKLSYEEPVTIPHGWRTGGGRGRSLRTLRRLLAARLGWRPFVAWFDIPDAGGAASYHFELAVARDLEVVDAGFAVANEPHPVEASVGPLPGRRVHMYLAAPSGGRGFAWGSIRAQRRGLLFGGLVLSGATVVLLGVAGLAAGTIANSPADSGSLLLALPGAFAAFLSRPDDHPLTSRLLVGTRALIVLSGLCSFAAATLVALGASGDALRDWLPLLAMVAFNVFLLLLVTYLFPRAPQRSLRT